MTEIKNIFYNETIYKEELENGLTVYLLPKKDYVTFSGIFTTNFGSFDTTFTPIGENESITVPEGVAHFLEHKMFESSDGEDVMKKFSLLGVNVNAFTSFDRTCYTISGTDNINEAVNLLLDFVQEPAFTEESVNREKSIIEQEILMYADSPKNYARSNLLKCLYGEENKIWREIGGTPESIYAINKDILMKAYNRFYHPSNMVLVLSGGFDPKTIIDIIKANQSKKDYQKSTVYHRDDNVFDPSIVSEKTIGHFNIKTPIVLWGTKYPFESKTPTDTLKMSFAIDYLIDSNFSSFSSFNEDLRKEGLGEVSVGYSASYYNGYGYLSVTATTNKYDKLYNFIDKKFKEIFEKPIELEKLKVWKRANHTNHIKILNSIDRMCNYISDFHFINLSLFDFIDIPAQITVEDIQRALELLKQAVNAKFLVLPKE